MSGIICWLFSLVVLAGICAVIYYGLQYLGAAGLKREEEERAALAAERKAKRIAKFGHDPMEATPAGPPDPTVARLAEEKAAAKAKSDFNDPELKAVSHKPAGDKPAAVRPPGKSIVLLNSAARSLDRDQLIDFVQTAWGVEAAVNDPNSGERVDVMDHNTAHLSIGGFDFDVLQVARAKTDVTVAVRAKTAAPDLQAVADSYLYALGVTFRGPAGLIDDDAIYPLVGKLAAQLIASDTLGLLLPQSQRIVKKTDRTAELLSGEDPIAALKN